MPEMLPLPEPRPALWQIAVGAVGAVVMVFIVLFDPEHRSAALIVLLMAVLGTWKQYQRYRASQRVARIHPADEA